MELENSFKSFETVMAPFMIIFVALILMDVILKGIGLWRSARNGQKWWFVGLMFVNSLGILPIIYLVTHPEKKTAASKTE